MQLIIAGKPFELNERGGARVVQPRSGDSHISTSAADGCHSGTCGSLHGAAWWGTLPPSPERPNRDCLRRGATFVDTVQATCRCTATHYTDRRRRDFASRRKPRLPLTRATDRAASDLVVGSVVGDEEVTKWQRRQAGVEILWSLHVASVATALLCIAFGDMALAQDAAPACGGKVLENCAPNSGDTAWMLTSVALCADDDHPRPRPISTAAWCARRTSAIR